MLMSPEDREKLKELERKVWHHELALCFVLGALDVALLVVAINLLSALATVIKPIVVFTLVVILLATTVVSFGLYRITSRVKDKKDSE